MNMQTIIGIPASTGIAIGEAYCFQDDDIHVQHYHITDTVFEKQRLFDALTRAREQLRHIYQNAESEIGREEAAIFEAHMLILDDSTLIETAISNIVDSFMNAESAWFDTIESIAQQFDNMDVELFRARATDIRDVGKRVIYELTGQINIPINPIKPSIIVARDLVASDTVLLDKKLVLGFCTAEGGPTSHTAILAKAMGLPAVVGLGTAILGLKNGTHLILDGGSGKVILYPDESTCMSYAKKKEAVNKQLQDDLQISRIPAVTADGHAIEVVANVGSVDDALSAISYGGDGIGLLRTEFLYLNTQNAPTQDKQLEIYRAILNTMGKRPVVVRTLDVGGDKNLPYIQMKYEDNPFLGCRGIRLCLEKPDIFKPQLRALLMASPGSNLRIMFPMVSTLDELRQAKAIFFEARDEVLADGHAVESEIQLGIMVEVPSVVFIAEHFAKEVDFFSIGTNDLTQYTFAAERTNEKVAHLGDACHPAVLRQVDRVIRAGHDAGIWVGVCGELASDPDAIPILLGLGLDEFSVAVPSIPKVKAAIRQMRLEDAWLLAEVAINLESAEKVRHLVRSWLS